jgi:hypothetical protein
VIGRRGWHRFYAWVCGYGWLPCPLCGTPFGGHQWRDIGGRSSTIPDPKRPGAPGAGVAICPACTRAGRGSKALRRPR